MLGESSAVNGKEGLTVQSARKEIFLTLTNKFEVPEDDDSDMRALFVRSVFLFVFFFCLCCIFLAYLTVVIVGVLITNRKLF